jgi:hypothetical protein
MPKLTTFVWEKWPIPGLGKNPGNSKKPMGMGKTGFYREKWEKREKLPFLKYMFKKHVKSLANK